MLRRLLKVTAIVLLLSVVLVFYLVRFHGLRFEVDGSGAWPVLSFYDREEHLRAIEQNRVPAPAVAEVPAPAAPVPVSTPVPVEARPYWTDFRGPRRDGHYSEKELSMSWPSDGPKRLWRKPIGGGYASFVGARGKVFTIEQRGNQEVVAAYDLRTGGQVWSQGWDAFFQESMGGDGPRSTPTWNDGRIYALGAAGRLECLDAESGRRVWSKNILEENGAENLQWGMAGSPLVVGEEVIVAPGGSGGKSVVAYNKATGERVWSALDDKAAYSSPVLATLGGVEQIVLITGSRVVGLSKDGKLLWDYPWVTSYDVNASQPVIVGGNRVFVSSGYGKGAALIRIGKDGATRVWENNRMKNKFSSSVLHEGHVYGLDEAILACVNVDTGELKWKGGRYGYGQILLASGHVVVATEDGDVALVRATPASHQEVVRFPAISGKTWNHSVIVDGVLLVRNSTEMSAFQLP